MDSSSENTQDPSPAAASSEATVQPLETGFRFTIACFMIFCLHYLGCELDIISQVLASFDLGSSRLNIARYIKEAKLLRYDEMTGAPNTRRTFNRGTRFSLTVDFAQGRPVQLIATGGLFSTFSLGKMVSFVSNGRTIVTIFVEGHLQFCSWDERDVFAPPTAD
ncbi:hypothetical protein MMC29_005561, partial [Sticta canariensis]|nr:hypothetical protein [Sticta canariensis]